MQKFIDIHTHNPNEEIGVLRVVNVEKQSCSGLVSRGLHPWYLDKKTIEDDFEILSQNAKSQIVVMIGECGLDRNIETNFAFQTDIFIRQIQLAERLQKPVIIHCVRAFPELISLKKRLNPSVPMVVHGFNNNAQICEQLVKNDFYLSFGAALLNIKSNAAQLIPKIPKDRLFLETDDKDCAISSIFVSASTYLEIPVEALKEIITNNFLRITDNYAKKFL